MDVIYHQWADDRAALAEMTRVLKPGGLLLVNVPAFEHLSGAHDRAVLGARRYTKPKLAALMERAGLEMVHQTYWNAWLLPAMFARRMLADRERGAEGGTDLALPPDWLNRLIGRITTAEATLGLRLSLPLGGSLFAAAARRERP